MSAARYQTRKLTGQPTPTGIGSGTIHEVVDSLTGAVVMRTWNVSDARSQARYLNKYGPEVSRKAPDHSSAAWGQS